MSILRLEPPAVLAARLRARAGHAEMGLRIAGPLELDDEQRHAIELDVELDRAAAAALDRMTQAIDALSEQPEPLEPDETIPF
jgi:hypothetical protein